MKKVVAIGGEHGTGKTTLVKRVMEHYGFESFRTFTYGLLTGYIAGPLVILGAYPVSPGSAAVVPDGWGTDKLSALCMTDAIAFVENLESIRREKARETVILFEGDRLFSGMFLKKCRDHSEDLIVLIMTASKEARSDRGANRKRPNAGKVYSIGRSFGARVLQNETWEDHEDNFKRLLKYL